MKKEDSSKGIDIAKLDFPSHPHRRQINADEQKYLAKLCSQVFGTEIDPKVIEKIMNYVNFVEKKMIGRMASHVEDLIIHYLMRYFSSLIEIAESGDYEHMEIGTLFGGTVLLAHHAIHLAERSFPIHVIDPFEGYYGQGKDIITKEDITEKNFIVNLGKLDVPREEVVIHKGLSTDKKIIDKCQKFKLLSLLIDGDHSYNGVKNDWINFAHLVVPGGYVLIDNYNDQYWPDVMNYMNNEVLSNLRGRWEIALVYANSLLLRRTSQEEDKDLSDAQRLFHELKEKEKEKAEVQAKAEQLQKEKTEVQAKVEQLQKEKTEVQAKGEQLQKEKAEVQAKAEQLQKEKAGLQAKAEQLQKEKAEAQAMVKELEIGKAKVEARVKELEREKGELRASVEQLQAELKNLGEMYKTEAERFKREQENIQNNILQVQTEMKRVDEEHRIEVEKLTMDINSLIEESRKKDEYINELLDSLSWKITSPLRIISKPFIERKKK